MLTSFSLALATAVTVVTLSGAQAGAVTGPRTSDGTGDATTATLNRHLEDPAIVESSGLARSTYQRALVWTHNDSGGEEVIYGVDRHSNTRSTVRLLGVSFRDWEDISSGPGHTLYVGDIGDNRTRRTTIQVYRVREPRAGDRAVRATRFDLAYPDGSHDAEGMMVHPTTGRVYIATKSPDGGALYAAPVQLSTSGVNRLTRVADGLPNSVTAASFTPDGSRFVLCNYGSVFVYDSVSAEPVTFRKPQLRQGESLTVNRRGTGLLMGSEGVDSPVYRVPLPS